jgi:hypothetical protein
MSRRILFKFLFLLFAGVCILSCNDRAIKRKIAMGYRGKIVDSYFLHGTHFKVDTGGGALLDFDSPTGSLIRNAQIGDSIIKIKDENICILKHGVYQKRLKYVYDGVGEDK